MVPSENTVGAPGISSNINAHGVHVMLMTMHARGATKVWALSKGNIYW